MPHAADIAAIPDDPLEILKSPYLDVVPYAERIQHLSDRLGIDLSATVSVLNVIPLCQSRARHPDMRRVIAAQIAENSDALKAAIPGMVAARMGCLAQPGQVDVMERVVQPLVGDMISALIGVPLVVADSSYISRVFSQSIGVSKRRKLEVELRALHDSLQAAFPEADAVAIGLKMSLAILGRDALMGTLGCSLHHLFAGAQGKRLDQVVWPALPTRTGVPYIDRVALCPVSVARTMHDAGAVLRADLARLNESDDPRAAMSFFGAGAHLCLGRALALDLWKAMMRWLGGAGTKVSVVHYALRRDDVFHIPETFLVEVLA